MVSIDSITDTSRCIVKVTGPCSMSSPCPGLTCPEHGMKRATIKVPAHAANLTAHVTLDAPRVLTHADHPAVPEGETFTAIVALWSWGGGSRVSLHGPQANCLAYYPQDGDVIPEWLPRPPAEWDAAAAAFIAAVTAKAVD